MKTTAQIGLLCVTLSVLPACTTFETERIDYRSTSKGQTLDVPPDLTQLSRDSRYTVPGGPVTASGYQNKTPVSGGPNVASGSMGDVRVMRQGDARWLAVERSPDKIWTTVQDFWTDAGFALIRNDAALGIVETDWAENRAKLPQDFVRSALGKLLDGLYSTGERDKFRTRIESSVTGGSEIYITHRGMQEVYENSRKESTVWQPRRADAELEAEFLRRLMVRLGTTTAAAQAAVAAPTPVAQPTVTTVSTIGGLPGLEITDTFDRAWRRVGLALDRSGFTVEDRDRGQGTYFVRYVESGADKKEGNFFTKLFSGSDASAALQKYRVVLKTEGSKVVVTVAAVSPAPEAAANAKRIAELVAQDLK